MIRKASTILIAILFVCLALMFVTKASGQQKKLTEKAIVWTDIDNGLTYSECNGPYISKFSDSKVSILKINPSFFNFELVLASDSDSTLHTIAEWCEIKNLQAGFNAGMYSLKDHISGSGFTMNFNHINNKKVNESFNALAVFNPKDKAYQSFRIVDMTNEDWKSVLNNYNSCFQSIRMIDNNGKAVYWKHKPVLRCSMCILAIDKSDNVLFIFTRSPYSVNEMINFLLNSELHIKTAMYIEGGPEASLYIKTQQNEIIKFGSYVSNACPNDKNTELRKMPNIIGVRKKIAN